MAKLTEQGQQEVTRYIEVGQTSPDQYRSLSSWVKTKPELDRNGNSPTIAQQRAIT